MNIKKKIQKELFKLAFGKGNDVEKLLYLKEDEAEKMISKYNLKGLQEVSRDGKGGIKIKHFNRLDAAKLLIDFVNASDNKNFNLYDALEESVEKIYDEKEDEQIDLDENN